MSFIRQDNKERILQVAEEIFAAKGFAGARVNEIADRAEVNKRMIYHYYSSKEGLYTAVLKANFQKIYDIHREILYPPGNLIPQINSAIREYFYFLAATPNFVRLMEWEFLQGFEHARELLSQYIIYGVPLGEKILDKGKSEGIIHPDVDCRQLLLSINAMCFFYFNRIEALNHIWEEDMYSAEMIEKRLNHVLQVVFRAILVNPENWEEMQK